MLGPTRDTEKAKIDLRRRRRTRREVHPRNSAGENEPFREVEGYAEITADGGLNSSILTLPTNMF